MEGQKIWNNILAVFKEEISGPAYKTWFSGSRLLEFKKSDQKPIFVVAVKSNFVKEQLEARYLPKIVEIARSKGYGEAELIFIVSSGEKQKAEEVPIFSGKIEEVFAPKKLLNSLNPNSNFDNFVVGVSNNLAYFAAGQITSNLGSLYNPFLVHGPSGVGKTHLLQAIGNEVSSKVRDAKVVYVSSEKFTNDYIESLRNKTQEAFRAKYRKADLLLVDDIQFFSGKEGTQDEFFHTFNEIYLSGRQVVLACDRHPKELGKMKDRLVSRFLGGMSCAIGLPDLEMKVAIVKSKCQNWGLSLDDEVTSFISKECRGGAREIEGMLTSVAALSKILGGNITIDSIRDSFAQKTQVTAPKLTISRIIDCVCRHFKISYQEIKSQSRKASVVFARQTLMYLLRSEAGLPLEEIGNLLGGRDHSTVIHGIEKVEGDISLNQSRKDEILRLKSLINS